MKIPTKWMESGEEQTLAEIFEFGGIHSLTKIIWAHAVTSGDIDLIKVAALLDLCDSLYEIKETLQKAELLPFKK